MHRIQLWGYRCERCGHEWLPRDKDHEPRVCPKCKSPYWNRPRTSTVRRAGAPSNGRTTKPRAVSSGVSSLPKEFVQVIEAMPRIAGWHGTGSRAISQKACAGAIDFVEKARSRSPRMAMPDVSPSPRGGITLVWRDGDISLMIRVSSRYPDEVYFQREGPRYRVETGTQSRDAALDRLMSLFKAKARR